MLKKNKERSEEPVIPFDLNPRTVDWDTIRGIADDIRKSEEKRRKWAENTPATKADLEDAINYIKGDEDGYKFYPPRH